MKVCFKCSKEKFFSEFYKHKGMRDGFLNKCKVCCKLEANMNESKNRQSEEWCEKERQRQRLKYKRLDYKDKQKIWDKNKPWKKDSIYKGLSKRFKTDKGTELHHWNYKKSHLTDVFLMDIKQHRRSHKYLEFDSDNLIFKDLQGNSLDTKEKHFKYLQDLGISFLSYQPIIPIGIR